MLVGCPNKSSGRRLTMQMAGGKLRAHIASPLIGILTGISVVFPLAAAVLPDPRWIGGVYDGGDDDDLIAQSTDVGSAGQVASLVPSLPVELLPSCTPGAYDGGDLDDVVQLVTSTSGVVPSSVPGALPGRVAVGIPQTAPEGVPTAPVAALRPRAPPA